MIHKKHNVSAWLETAVAGIRFRPDREAVERELREHIEDKTADLMRIFPDMTEEEARERALSQMGDPVEIGKELAKIHKPWLGYLWRVSQTVLGAVLLLAVIVGANYIGGGYTGWFEPGEGLPMDLEGCSVTELEHWEGRIKVDGYTLTMPRAALYSREDGQELGVALRTVSPYFWDREGRFYERISAVDSLGNRYPSYYAQRMRWQVEKWNCLFGISDGHGPFRQDYILWVDGLPPEAEWVRLEYNWMGHEFSMTVELKEAGA